MSARRLTRRAFVHGSGAALAASLSWHAVPRAARAADRAHDPFLHGVASGDPLHDAVVLWTRVSVAGGQAAEVRWLCAEDPQMRRVIASGTTLALPERDHTVAVDVGGLAPGRHYYYRFAALGWLSPGGRTRTLPVACDRVRLAVASCANYGRGFFNAYAGIAAQPALDAVVHLGDYIYEYGPEKDGRDDRIGRPPRPDHELVTLGDYRARYAQYRSDPDLQQAHRLHPFIAVWDDHEFANNAYRDGAKNHQPEKEGSWPARRAAAARAYREWLPLRSPAPWDRPERIYRSFRFGSLVELALLDGRIIGRDRQVAEGADVAALREPARSMLGAEQERWLAGTLAAARDEGMRWRFVGQQTMLGQLRRPDGSVGNLDQWDGYPATRERLFDALEATAVDNLVVLTGDIHSSWAVELARDPFAASAYDPRSGRGALGVELICPGITSDSPYGPPDEARAVSAYFRSTHPHVKMQEGIHRGYMVVDAFADRVEARWQWVPSISERGVRDFTGAAFAVDAGRAHLRPLSLGSRR